MSEELKNAEEWLELPDFKGVSILDPDGWDRRNFYESWNEKVSRGEFEKRLVQSTVSISFDSPMHPKNMLT